MNPDDPNSQNYSNSQGYPYSENYPHFQTLLNSSNYPNSQYHQNSQYYHNTAGEVQPSENQKVVKIAWRVKEDIALMSAWCFASENKVRGKNQKGATMWSRIHTHYHQSQKENPEEIGCRNLDQMKGRWKRLAENGNKWVGACKEASRVKKSGTSQADLEKDAHCIYEEGGSKFNDLVVFNEVMCKHPKWSLINLDHGSKHDRSEPADASYEESGDSSKRSKTSVEGGYAVHYDPDIPGLDSSTISRPTGRDKAKKKGKGKISESSELAASIDKLRLTRELENEKNIMRLAVEREKIQMNTIKINQRLLNSLLNKAYLTPSEEEMKEQLIATLFGK